MTSSTVPFLPWPVITTVCGDCKKVTEVEHTLLVRFRSHRFFTLRFIQVHFSKWLLLRGFLVPVFRISGLLTFPATKQQAAIHIMSLLPLLLQPRRQQGSHWSIVASLAGIFILSKGYLPFSQPFHLFSEPHLSKFLRCGDCIY